MVRGVKIKFKGVDKDVYNITAPFKVDGAFYIAGRVEATGHRSKSKVMFFKAINGIWELDKDMPVFNMEDPFFSIIKKEIIFGGVEVFSCIKAIYSGGIGFRTIFYKGKNLRSLKKIAQGPDLMKDIRLLELPNGKIFVATRPQGEIGGRGTIGFIVLDSLDDLNPYNIMRAKLIKGQFVNGEWGGTNELHLLDVNRVGFLAHRAYKDLEGYHYSAVSFEMDLLTQRVSQLKTIAVRNDFPSGKYKRKELKDVVFPGGLVRNKDGTALLYCGLSDAEAGVIKIPDPFLKK